jgi:Xaa-Pro dipeptidase
MIGDDRRQRLIGVMAEAGLDMLLVYGNAWQCDYLRYATDFGILEGQALALVRNDGHITLYLDSPLEAAPDRCSRQGAQYQRPDRLR